MEDASPVKVPPMLLALNAQHITTATTAIQISAEPAFPAPQQICQIFAIFVLAMDS
jgi:hypothetical protein